VSILKKVNGIGRPAGMPPKAATLLSPALPGIPFLARDQGFAPPDCSGFIVR